MQVYCKCEESIHADNGEEQPLSWTKHYQYTEMKQHGHPQCVKKTEEIGKQTGGLQVTRGWKRFHRRRNPTEASAPPQWAAEKPMCDPKQMPCPAPALDKVKPDSSRRRTDRHQP